MIRNSLPGLLQRKAIALDEAKAIVETAIAEGRAMKPEELEQVQKLRQIAGEMAIQIEKEHAYERRMAATAVPLTTWR